MKRLIVIECIKKNSFPHSDPFVRGPLYFLLVYNENIGRGTCMKKCILILIIFVMILAPCEVHGESPYRFLAFGNSLTQHPVTNYWWNTCGMAASRPEYDWVQRVESQLKKTYGSVHTDIIHNAISSDIPTPAIREQVEEEIKCLSQTPYQFITIQGADNVDYKDQLNTYEEKLTWLVTILQKYNPQAQIVIIGNFHMDTPIKTSCEEIQKRVVTTYGCKYADLSGLNENKAYCSAVGDVVYDAQGYAHHVDSWTVARHPNDKGMEYIAYKVLEQLGISLDVGHDFDDLHTQTENKEQNVAVDSTINGWIKKGKKTYYYFHGLKAQGLTRIGKRYYYFDAQGCLMKTPKQVGKVKYYVNKQGILQLKKVNKTYFNQNNLPVNLKEGMRQEAYLLGCLRVTNSKKSLKKAYQWVTHIKKKASSQSWKQETIANHAIIVFNTKRGDDYAKACAFAYCALALGVQPKIYKDQKNHYCVKVKKKSYLFGTYDQKKKSKELSIKKASLKAIKVTYKKKPQKLVKYDQDTGSLYYDNGQAATGLVAYKNKFYDFDDTGVLNQEQTYKINKAATIQNKINDLEKIIGKPISKNYSASCFGDGEDGLWVYKHFILSTFKGYDGVEIYIAVKDR